MKNQSLFGKGSIYILQMEVTYRSLEWIVKALQANNIVPNMAPPAIPNLEEERKKGK